MNSSILKTRGVKPFLAIAFLNAFTDVGHKIILHNAIYKYYNGPKQMALAAIINALILLPFVLTFTPAGWLSDRFPKVKIIQYSAFAAIPITLLITLTYASGQFWIAFGATFVLALQSAIYGPSKYGYIQELLGPEKLSRGIGALQSVTIVAILLSSVMYSAGFEYFYKGSQNELGNILQCMVPLGFVLVTTCVLEFYLSFKVQDTHAPLNSESFQVTKYVKGQYLKTNLVSIFTNKPVWLCIQGLGIFWAVNQVILASFPAFFKEVTGISNVLIAQGVAALAGVGIIIGCIWSAKQPQMLLTYRPIFFAGLAMAICLAILPSLTGPWSMSLLILFYGFAGGCYVVPLGTMLQINTKPRQLGRVLAGKNFFQNLLMLCFLGGSVFFTTLKIPLRMVFYILLGSLVITLLIHLGQKKGFHASP